MNVVDSSAWLAYFADAAARARGRKGGRPRKLAKAKAQLLYRLYDEREHTITEICTMLGISKPTLYSYLGRRGQ